MKLKKNVKFVLVLLLVTIIGGVFYSFNKWFFTKYKDVGKIEEKQENKSNLDLEEKNLPISNEEENKEEVKQDEVPSPKKVRQTEIYYCSDGDILAGKECITKVESGAIKLQAEDNRDYYELRLSFADLANMYGISIEDAKVVLKEACLEELKGEYEISEDLSKGSCTFTDMEEDTSFTYICLDESYTLVGDKCIHEERIPAKIRYGCPEGYVLDGIYCKEK